MIMDSICCKFMTLVRNLDKIKREVAKSKIKKYYPKIFETTSYLRPWLVHWKSTRCIGPRFDLTQTFLSPLHYCRPRCPRIPALARTPFNHCSYSYQIVCVQAPIFSRSGRRSSFEFALPCKEFGRPLRI